MWTSLYQQPHFKILRAMARVPRIDLSNKSVPITIKLYGQSETIDRWLLCFCIETMIDSDQANTSLTHKIFTI